MSQLFFLLAIVVVGAIILLLHSSFGEGLVEEAKVWWKLRTMQIAAAVTLGAQMVELYLEYFAGLWPDLSGLLMQMLPGQSANTVTLIGAAFGIWRLVKQRGLPRLPRLSDDTDAAGA